jgi:hypothetical protein
MNLLPMIVEKIPKTRIRGNGRRVVRFHCFLTTAYLRGRAEDRWVEWLDSKLALLLDRDIVDPRAYGGKAYDE